LFRSEEAKAKERGLIWAVLNSLSAGLAVKGIGRRYASCRARQGCRGV
jgi:hypothetical protein